MGLNYLSSGNPIWGVVTLIIPFLPGIEWHSMKGLKGSHRLTWFLSSLFFPATVMASRVIQSFLHYIMLLFSFCRSLSMEMVYGKSTCEWTGPESFGEEDHNLPYNCLSSSTEGRYSRDRCPTNASDGLEWIARVCGNSIWGTSLYQLLGWQLSRLWWPGRIRPYVGGKGEKYSYTVISSHGCFTKVNVCKGKLRIQKDKLNYYTFFARHEKWK